MPISGWKSSSDREAGARAPESGGRRGGHRRLHSLFQHGLVFDVERVFVDLCCCFSRRDVGRLGDHGENGEGRLVGRLAGNVAHHLAGNGAGFDGNGPHRIRLFGPIDDGLAGNLLEGGVGDFAGPLQAFALLIAGRNEQQAGQRSAEQEAG